MQPSNFRRTLAGGWRLKDFQSCLNIVLKNCFRTFDAYAECKILALPAKYDVKPYAYGFQKDSPFLPVFNYYLKEMREKGSMKQILDKYEPQPQVCPDYSGQPLGFGACFTAFLVLVFGAGLALILFVVESFGAILGLNMPFLSMYGMKDFPDFNEANFMRILMIKDNEIDALKKKVLGYEGNKAKRSYMDTADSWTWNTGMQYDVVYKEI